MEIQIRTPCPFCFGTGMIHTQNNIPSKPLLCTNCKDGYEYSWVDLSELPIMLGGLGHKGSKKGH